MESSKVEDKKEVINNEDDFRMEFEKEMEIEQSNHEENDEELLQLQRRKSTPKVVIQEFINNADGEASDDSGASDQDQQE